MRRQKPALLHRPAQPEEACHGCGEEPAEVWLLTAGARWLLFCPACMDGLVEAHKIIRVGEESASGRQEAR